MMGVIQIKRIYAPPTSDGGKRVLVDRIWPRGVSKKSAKLDLWLREIAPSAQLRKWFGHDPQRFCEFRDRYRKELEANRDAVDELHNLSRHDNATLLFAARDRRINHAVVLAEFLQEKGFDVDNQVRE